MTTEPDDRIKALLVESVDAELGPRLHVTPDANAGGGDEHLSDPRRVRRTGFARVAPFAAAATVAAVGVTIAVAVSTSSDSPTPVAGSGVPGALVTCAASTGANPAADQAALQARAAKLAHGGEVSSQVSGSAISIVIPGATRADVAGLCRSTSVQLRPLIAPAVRVMPPADPGAIAGTDFDLPADESAYDGLTSAQQAYLAGALAATDCAQASITAVPVVACDTGASGHARMAMLLGRPVVDGAHVASARAQAPNVAGGGSTEWTVALRFDRTGTDAWAGYTTGHNLGDGPSSSGFASPSTCRSTDTPCADFVGFVVDGSVVSVPVNESAVVGGTTQISGQFDESSAKRLAAELRAGQLPVPVTTTSTVITK